MNDPDLIDFNDRYDRILGLTDEVTRKRMGVELVKDVDKFLNGAEGPLFPEQRMHAESIKRKVGAYIFRIPEQEAADLIERAVSMPAPVLRDDMTLEQVECELKNADRYIRTLNRDLGNARNRAEALERKKVQILSQPVDDWPNGTYLVIHPGNQGRTRLRPPRLLHKDANGEWWTTQQVSSPISWRIVCRELESPGTTTWVVTNMQEVAK